MTVWAAAKARLGSTAPALTAGVLGVAALTEIWLQPRPELSGWAQPRWLTSLVALAGCVMVAAARRYPSAALIGCAAAAAVGAILVAPRQGPFETFLALLVVGFLFGAGAGWPPTPVGLLVAAAVIASVETVLLVFGQGPEAAPVGIFLAAAVCLGWLAAYWQDRSRRLQHLAHELAVERERRASEAVEAERARISRELHDVVAHNVSVMVIQAQAASRCLDRDPQTARTALSVIEATGRRTVDEMRWTLGVLRNQAEDAELEPLPGLAGIPDLIASVRSAGLEAQLQVQGTATAVPAGVERCAYRIVQEGLTNALKHGRPAVATVRIAYHPERLHIEVCNSAAAATGDGGLGLIGLRERVALMGGRLKAGPGDSGRWVLQADLPLTPP